MTYNKKKPFILIINGSPRKSNTFELAKNFEEGAKKGGAKTILVNLAKLGFSGCCGWSECFYENYCIVNDAFFSLHKKMLKANAFCFACPNYFNNVSGLFKNFIDRTNPYTRPPLYKGTPTSLLCVGGYNLDSVRQLEGVLKEFCRIHFLPVFGSVLAVADKKLEILEKPEYLRQSKKLGKEMALFLALKQKKEGPCKH